MKIVVTAVPAAFALVCLSGVVLLVAQTKQPASPQKSEAPVRAAAAVAPSAKTLPGATADAVKYRAWVEKNCVGCHNKRTPSPAENPVNLEAASFDDLLGNAGTWERVLR